MGFAVTERLAAFVGLGLSRRNINKELEIKAILGVGETTSERVVIAQTRANGTVALIASKVAGKEGELDAYAVLSTPKSDRTPIILAIFRPCPLMLEIDIDRLVANSVLTHAMLVSNGASMSGGDLGVLTFSGFDATSILAEIQAALVFALPPSDINASSTLGGGDVVLF